MNPIPKILQRLFLTMKSITIVQLTAFEDTKRVKEKVHSEQLPMLS
jgi:hypothetical protein